MSRVVWEPELAARLRGEFDGSFARAPEVGGAALIQLLRVRIGPHPHAIRLAEVAQLAVDRRVTRVPGALPEMLGLAGMRGALLPVYDLRLLLGYPAGPPTRWTIIAAGSRIGLAFDEIDGHTAVDASAILATVGGAGPAGGQVVVEDGARVALLHLPSLIDEITGRVRRARPDKER